MNKLRLIKIYELKGKVHPIEQSVIDLLDGIETKPCIDYILYQKNGELYFAYYLNSNNIWLSYYLHNSIYNLLKWSSEETKEIMKYLLDKHLKLKINNVK